MRLHEMRREINEARSTIENAEIVAGQLAGILNGRLRSIPDHLAANLKRQLQDFNITTGKWKNK